MANPSDHKDVKDAAEALQDAKAKRRRLADEQISIPQRMQDAALRDRNEKARVAREGGDVATVGADEGLEHLRSREAALPFEIWAADVEIMQLEVARLQAQQRVAAELRPDLQSRRDKLAEDLEKIKAEHGEASQELRSLDGSTPTGFTVNRKRDELRDLEERGPSV